MKFRSDLEALILSVVSTTPMHGYEIAKQIRQESDDQFKYGEAQLYPALRNLEEAGFLSADWVIQEGKPNRRVYSITESGHLRLTEQLKEWSKFVATVNRFLPENWVVQR